MKYPLCNILFILILLFPSLCRAEEFVYEITAAYNEKKHTIEGTERITFTNTGESPLSEIYLFLYPNLYLEKSKDQYHKAYPVAFNPGSIEIVSIHDAFGNPLVATDFFGAKTLTEIRLSVPIPPKATYSLSVRFVTVIPERYGVFGYYRDWVTLQGGWHPYLPALIDGKWDLHALPPPSQFQLDITVPKGLAVVASAPLGSKTDAIPYFSLSFGRNMIRKEKDTHDVHLAYTFSKRNKRYGEEVFKAAESALSFFSSTSGPLPPMKMQLTHASLYKDIVATGERLLYVDPRLFKVFPLLKKYHEMRIAKGVFQLLWDENLPWEEPWVIEMMATITAEQFSQQHYPNDAGLKSWLKPIAFLPLIDQILYADDPLLRQIYFKKTASDSETIVSFHQPILPYYPWLKKLLSPEQVSSVVTDYKRRVQLGEKPSFKALLLDQDKTSSVVKQIFEKDFFRTGFVDFGIERIVRKKVGDGYQTQIALKKEGLGVEPVEIILHKKDGTKISLPWNGVENRYRTVVTTLSPVAVVEIDPEEITRDIYRGNNRDPEKWKWLLKEFNLKYNLTTHFVDYNIGLQFQPIYSTKNRINIGFLHSEPKAMGSLQYSHVLPNQHTVSTGLSFQEPTGMKAVKTANISYSLRYPNIPFVQEYLEWLTGQYPQWGITFGFDKNLTGNSSDYTLNAVFDLQRSFIFSNYHQIQTRLMTGVSTGELLKNTRFFLGGDNGVRGYTPLRFGGENINLFTLEYRFPLLYETDINLSGLALTHTLQGIFFVDAGTVASRSLLLNLEDYRSSIGGGIRWFVDFLGIMPMTFGLDVAWPINSPVVEEDKPHYYIKGGRLF